MRYNLFTHAECLFSDAEYLIYTCNKLIIIKLHFLCQTVFCLRVTK